MAEKRRRSPIQKKRTKKRALHKKKKDVQALSLATACSSAFLSAVSVLRSAPPSASASASVSAMSEPELSALLSSVLLFASGVSMSIPGSSAFLSSALPSSSGVSVSVPRLSAPLSVSFVSGVSVLVPESSAPSSMSGVPVSMLGV